MFLKFFCAVVDAGSSESSWEMSIMGKNAPGFHILCTNMNVSFSFIAHGAVCVSTLCSMVLCHCAMNCICFLTLVAEWIIP